MSMIVTASAPHRCDANATGFVAHEWGMDALPCQVRTGLRYFTDRAGIRRAYCGSEGHERDAKRRFGLYVSEVDSDGLTSSKARDELRDGVAYFEEPRDG